MLPDLPLLLALVIGLWRLESVERGASVDALFAAGGTAAATLVVLALCRMAADRALRRIEEEGPDAALGAGFELSLVPLLGWFAALFPFGWASFVGTLVPPEWPLVAYLLLFVPLALMFGAGWLSARRIEARIVPSTPGPWGAITRGLKRNGLVLVPLFALLVIQEAVRVLALLDVAGVRRVLACHEAFPDFGALVLIGIILGVTWFAPALARRFLKAEPLPPGPLRASIERLLAGIRVRCRDVLLWKTDNRVINAMVVGLSGGTRYVFVTDGLLTLLPPEEVVAVVAHEAGHAKKRHLPTYFVVSLALLLLMKAAEEVFVPTIGEAGGLFLTVLFLAVFWFGMLGWLSRRFERQADAFGAEHGGDLQPDAPAAQVPGVPFLVPHGAGLLMTALQRIYTRVGGGRHFRHGAPPERIAFIARYSTDPRIRAEFQASMRSLRIGLWIFVLVAFATTAARLPGGLVRGEANLALLEGEDRLERAHAAESEGRSADAKIEFERARDRFKDAAGVLARRPDDPQLKLRAAVGLFHEADTALHFLGDVPRAKAAYESLLRLVGDPPMRRTARLVFDAHVDLGRLALRNADRLTALIDARDHLKKADAISDETLEDEWRLARRRLLESAIGLKDDDPARAAEARRVLAQQASNVREGRDWEKLRRAAKEELDLAPAR